MNLIRFAIERPIAVVAAVLMITLFGWVALTTIPVQLAPDIDRPVIQVSTQWAGAAPAEVEREIVNRQEDVLRGLEGLEEMTSSARFGQARVRMTFALGSDMNRALLLVNNRLGRVSYPAEAQQPSLRLADDDAPPVAWYALKLADGNPNPIWTYGDFVEDVIQERLERVHGVAMVSTWGGTQQELQIIVDPERLARYGIGVTDVMGALRTANVALSAGSLDEGKRSYVVRTEGDLSTVERVQAVLVRSQRDLATGSVGRVTVGDLADVRFAYKDATSRLRHNGTPAIGVSVYRETGANVIEVMEGVRGAMDELAGQQIAQAGLTIVQMHDDTTYIASAISLVRNNIVIGGLLAALSLMLFLRSGRATLVVSIAIPVSVIGSFVAMAAFGRSLNVISLAGLAFAVGMVVDAAIVVLENIFRLRQQGHSAREAAYKGAASVWAAVLVSALTTVMVFVPILVMELEVGQLFRDIAVAISVSVLLSLLVAVTLIPSLAARLLNKEGVGDGTSRVRLPGIDAAAGGFARGLNGFTRLSVRRRSVGLVVVGGITASAVAATILFLPKLEYLPEGNRNYISGQLQPPPGYNLETSISIAERLESGARPLWASETGPESAPGGPPKIDNFFFVTNSNWTSVGVSAVEGNRVAELVPLLRRAVQDEPGTTAFIRQTSLFGRGIGGSRSISLDVSGDEIDDIIAVARRGMQYVEAAMPAAEGNQSRAQPGLELGAPEIRVVPDPVRLADAGTTAQDLAQTIDVYNDGARVAEIAAGGTRMDLTLRGPLARIGETQGIGTIPVVTGHGAVLPASALADLQITAGPTEIRRLERRRTVTLQIVPAPGIPLEVALETVQREVIAPLVADGLPAGISVGVSGTADQLLQTWNHMVWDLLLALAIVYLVMAVLFESFWYPLIIMFSVPVAAAGGIAGLALLNAFVAQPLDMLTLLGFVILVGIVVNNAILLVHQSLFHYREQGMPAPQAIQEATRNRLRPIFMSTLTSILGMLPLVVVPGAGSELYRGLGSVVLGGLSLSAVLTLLLIPPLLGMFMRIIEGDGSQRPALHPVEEAPSRAAAE